MLVCHCKAVTDRAIRAAVREGAQTRNDVAKACAAGMCCGGCGPAVDEIIEAEANRSGAHGFATFPELAVVS
jgi:bacterioferritin-associated ferredoxin